MPERDYQRLAFDCFVELGPSRSEHRLHALLVADPERIGRTRAPSLRTIERWSARFHWQDRLADLEREAAQADAARLVRALVEMNERHAREGVALQQRALERLQALRDTDMSPAVAVRALAEGVRLERLARGEVTDRTQLEGSADNDVLGGFSLAELRGLAALAQAELEGGLRQAPDAAGL